MLRLGFMLGFPIIRGFVCFASLLTLSAASLAEEKKQKKSSPEVIELSASIMEREATDGKKVVGGVDPLLWWSSRYLLEGPSHTRFVRALDAFNALTDAQVDAIPPLHRAVLQRQLWFVFDWFVGKYRRPAEPIDDGLKKKVVAALKKAALSKEQIATLPNPYETTAKSKRYPSDYDPEQLFEPFLPSDLFAEKGSWICLNPDFEEAAFAEIHGEDQMWRAAFTIFVSLPGGREATQGYLQKLEEFKLPFDTGRGGQMHPKTPQFPEGTRWALVRRGLLITSKGEIVSSPLVEGVQLRAFHLILPSFNPEKPEQSGIAVAKLNLHAVQVLAGADPILRALPGETNMPDLLGTRGHDDPFPDLAKSNVPTEGLRGCSSCHSRRPGIHSVVSRNLLFRVHVKATPLFRTGNPSQSHKFAIKKKTKSPSWKALRECWTK